MALNLRDILYIPPRKDSLTRLMIARLNQLSNRVWIQQFVKFVENSCDQYTSLF
ncbi:hypothetical protein KIN20_028287 [Parelaphostrongylus tenuis]|uniref:Uncharacterized protein n=1 Tax=Parelaphostrongylus tenuis TaxID=148309 RepID=A0AAD5WEP5_PARTN|nr:hypothetical protein KIN20_028287 [Parelaphostrongylus tenuis]